MRQFAYATIIVIGTLLVSNAEAWCNGVTNPTQETITQITQSVRGDVRRRIQERERSAVYARHPRELAPR